MHRSASCCLAILLLAGSAQALDPFPTGTILTTGAGLRVLDDGPLRSSQLIAGFPLRLSFGGTYGCSGGALAVGLAGELLVTDWNRDGIVRVDLETGAWEMVSDVYVGSGERLLDFQAFDPGPPSIAVEADGTILVARNRVGRGVIFRVDPVTGDRAPWVESAAPGPSDFFLADALALAPGGEILLSSFATYTQDSVVHQESKLFEIDPVTGALSVRAQDLAALRMIGLDARAPDDAFLAAGDRVLRVDAAGVVQTATGAGVGLGPAIEQGGPLVVALDDSLVLLDFGNGDPFLLGIDPATGARSLLSGRGVGAGPELIDPGGIAVAADGALLVLDCRAPYASPPDPAAVLRVDPATGDREVAFGPPAEADLPPLGFTLAIDSQQRIVIANSDALMRVDPETGERTVLSGTWSEGTVGGGPDFESLQTIAFAPGGDVLVTAFCRTNIFRVDATSGDRSVLSGSVGAGPFWECPRFVTMGGDGYAYVADTTLGAIFRVDIANGNRSIVSGLGHGSGSELWNGLRRIAWAGDSLYALERDSGRVFRVEPHTGARTLLASSTQGSGEPLVRLRSLAPSQDGGLLVAGEQNKVIRIDLATGHRTLVSSEPVYDLAAMPAPEPGGCAASLVVVALLAAGAVARESTRGAA